MGSTHIIIIFHRKRSSLVRYLRDVLDIYGKTNASKEGMSSLDL